MWKERHLDRVVQRGLWVEEMLKWRTCDPAMVIKGHPRARTSSGKRGMWWGSWQHLVAMVNSRHTVPRSHLLIFNKDGVKMSCSELLKVQESLKLFPIHK